MSEKKIEIGDLVQINDSPYWWGNQIGVVVARSDSDEFSAPKSSSLRGYINDSIIYLSVTRRTMIFSNNFIKKL